MLRNTKLVNVLINYNMFYQNSYWTVRLWTWRLSALFIWTNIGLVMNISRPMNNWMFMNFSNLDVNIGSLCQLTFSSTCSTMHLISHRNRLSPASVWCTAPDCAAVVYAAINNEASWLARVHRSAYSGRGESRRSGAGLAVATSGRDGD